MEQVDYRRTKAMFTNIFSHIIGEKIFLKFLYNNCMLLFYLFVKFLQKLFTKKKMQRIVDK